MSVCATCLKPGLPADGRHDCPGLGDIQLTRQLGRGLRVDTAPPRARMALTVLAEHGHGLAMQGADLINIADQVLYQVVGYDPESAALVLELVEDWRPNSPAPGFAPARPVAQSWGEPSGDPLVVEPYRNDRNQDRWVFRCWGTATCDGWLSLDHYSKESAERARDRHVREEHAEERQPMTTHDRREVVADAIRRFPFDDYGLDSVSCLLEESPDTQEWVAALAAAIASVLNPVKEQPMTTCTATIDGPHVLGGGPVHCTREAGHPENHVGPKRGADGKALWSDHHAGATPHRATPEEQQ